MLTIWLRLTLRERRLPTGAQDAILPHKALIKSLALLTSLT
jgi:hypothetical protein